LTRNLSKDRVGFDGSEVVGGSHGLVRVPFGAHVVCEQISATARLAVEKVIESLDPDDSALPEWELRFTPVDAADSRDLDVVSALNGTLADGEVSGYYRVLPHQQYLVELLGPGADGFELIDVFLTQADYGVEILSTLSSSGGVPGSGRAASVFDGVMRAGDSRDGTTFEHVSAAMYRDGYRWLSLRRPEPVDGLKLPSEGLVGAWVVSVDALSTSTLTFVSEYRGTDSPGDGLPGGPGDDGDGSGPDNGGATPGGPGGEGDSGDSGSGGPTPDGTLPGGEAPGGSVPPGTDTGAGGPDGSPEASPDGGGGSGGNIRPIGRPAQLARTGANWVIAALAIVAAAAGVALMRSPRRCGRLVDEGSELSPK
jgi:hypothetical protein